MTNEMLLGGLMILTVVAGIVITMTSSRNTGDGVYHNNLERDKNRDSRKPEKRGRPQSD